MLHFHHHPSLLLFFFHHNTHPHRNPLTFSPHPPLFLLLLLRFHPPLSTLDIFISYCVSSQVNCLPMYQYVTLCNKEIRGNINTFFSSINLLFRLYLSPYLSKSNTPLACQALAKFTFEVVTVEKYCDTLLPF